jgi:type I restriction enzyme S subunit
MRFSDFVTLQRGFDLPKTEMREGPFPVLGSTSVIGHHSEFKVEPPGVVTGRSGSLGVVQFVDERYWPHNTALWVKDFKGNQPKFVYYCMQGLDFARFNAGAGVPTLNRNHLDSLEVNVPPLPIQRRIAGILSVYDELIENNQRRIKILEAMARAIFQEVVQAGSHPAAQQRLVGCTYWRFISENVSVYSGTKRYYATADVEGLVVTGLGIDYPFAEKPSRAQKQPIPNSVWFARMKDTYKIAWYEAEDDKRAAETMLSSGFAGFEAIDPELWPLLFLTVSSKEFHVQKDLYCTGATQMSLTNEGLARIEMPIPDEADARALGRATQPILRQMLLLRSESDILRRTRDLLLPRLLSGELDVKPSAA